MNAETVHPPELVSALADLIVRLGANVQPGQIVALQTQPGQEVLARAVAERAYAQGALFVDLTMFDPHLKRARALHADPETLGFVPSWYGERMLALGEQRAARIAFSGPVAPHLMDDIDPELLGRDMLPRVKESGDVVNARTSNWVGAPCPNPEWARLVHPDLEPAAALARLWHEIAHVCRLDEPDPIAAWEARFDEIVSVADRLTELELDALHFEGPGTDLQVGLLRSGRWMGARFSTVDGLVHHPNLPTEEVFTSPDPARVDGTVRATKPLVTAGSVITGLVVRFEDGRAVEIDADTGAGTLRALAARDPGAGRLGEVALVDRAGRIGPLDTVFYDTLLDENAASHVAIGRGFPFAVGAETERAKVNNSEIHVDFMIGSDDVAVTGSSRDGRQIPLLRNGVWQV